MLSETSLVLFDIDGTLMRGAGPHHRDALQAGIFREMELHATTDGIDTAGTLDRDLITLMLRSKQIPEEALLQALPRIVEACEAAYLDNCASDLRDRVCPGVVDLLRSLKSEGVTIGVVTGNLQAIGWKKLELAGLREYFDVGAFSQDGSTRAALAQRATERAAAMRGTSSFANVSLIGDHRNDVIAAKANGFRAIAVATGVLSEQELSNHEPDLVVKDMTGLTVQTVLQAKNFSSLETSSGESRNSRAPIVPCT